MAAVSRELRTPLIGILSLAELTAVAFRKRQRVTLCVEPCNLQIKSEPQALLQILKALLDNAVKLTPEGECIDIEAAPAKDIPGVAVSP